MPFSLTPEQESLHQNMLELGRQVIYPRAHEWDERAEYPWPVHQVLSEQGLFGIMIPREYGGLGLSTLDFAVMIEGLAEGSSCGATIGAIETHSLGGYPVMVAGSDEQKRRFLPGIASGETLFAFSLTEPESGSDAGSITTRAERHGDEYIINGHKVFCTLGNLARYVTVFAKTQMDVGTRGISAFVVDTQQPGFTVGRIEKKMGLKGSPTAEIFYEDVRVPATNRLGNEGDGFKIAMATLNKGRLAVAADCTGIMSFCLKYAINYAKERTQFSEPIARLQAIQFMLADISMRIDTSRYLTYAAAEMLDRPGAARSDISRLTASAKCYTTDVRQQVISDAIQIMGGYGYMKDYPLERIYRDSKIYQIFDGTNQIQRIVIARSLVG